MVSHEVATRPCGYLVLLLRAYQPLVLASFPMDFEIPRWLHDAIRVQELVTACTILLLSPMDW